MLTGLTNWMTDLSVYLPGFHKTRPIAKASKLIIRFFGVALGVALTFRYFHNQAYSGCILKRAHPSFK